VRNALSLQAHPDRELAQQLHAEHPSVYPDSNHKPEMIIALNTFEALCKFKPLDEIMDTLAAVPEIEKAVTGERYAPIRAAFAAGDAKTALRQLLFTLLETDGAWVKSCVEEAVHRTAQSTDARHVLLRRLHAQYPGDVGVLAAMLLNHVVLQPGQALFLGPNEPHAYLSGDGVEAMACSDNVVRAGLTPKFRDAQTLARMLTYRTERPTIETGEPLPHMPCVRTYAPPAEFPEFCVERAAPADTPCELPAWQGESVLLVVEGVGRVAPAAGGEPVAVRAGSALLVPPAMAVRLEGAGLIAFRCRQNA
jgi:mannose-6-phosphate isomerase